MAEAQSQNVITLLYFAAASTATGKTIEQIPIPSSGLPLSSLSDHLASLYPSTNLAKVLQTSQWSVNEEMVDEPSSVTLKGGEEVAVIPPVSGGLQPHPIITKSAFRATRLTPSTFLVKEYNDIFSEHPHIYVKVMPSVNAVLVIDTGTGGKSNDHEVEVTSLRQFLETVNVIDNDNQPLNGGGKMKYVVVTTHCHYDHIRTPPRIDRNADSVILASGHSKAFLSLVKLPEHSLCNALHIRTPQYAPKLIPHGYIITSPSRPHTSLNITLLHTPGHTPDELAVYDSNEMMLYVGDSLYEHEPIIFPKEGSIVAWFESMDYLMTFVLERNGGIWHESQDKEVLINAGHRTAAQPALEVLSSSKAFMEDVVKGRELVRGRLKVRGEDNLVFEQAGGRFSLRCPERLLEEARRKIH
ncbi:Molybdopterin synthase sulfur carrier subunit [Leucoagaricus sp. SymC.cos]|nr:Molybdopterin synthase sulfur carrier subunit [Leucoagaricus sp. SymC.cos]